MPDTSPDVKRYRMLVPAVGTAGNDQVSPVVEVPYAATVTGVFYTPDAALSGANTNSRTLTLYDRGPADAGTTVIAQLALVSTVNLVLDTEKTITLSATPANLIVAAGDILEWNSLHVGTGITDPGGLVIVELTRN